MVSFGLAAAPPAAHLPPRQGAMTDARPTVCLHRMPHRGIGPEPTTKHGIDLGAVRWEGNTLRAAVATNQALSPGFIWTEEHWFVADGVLAEREYGGVIDRGIRPLLRCDDTCDCFPRRLTTWRGGSPAGHSKAGVGRGDCTDFS